MQRLLLFSINIFKKVFFSRCLKIVFIRKTIGRIVVAAKPLKKISYLIFFNEAKRNHEKPVVRRNYSPKKFTDFLLLTVFQNCIFASALIE